MCSTYCLASDCYHGNGSCIRGCVEGRYGPFCNNTCPVNCLNNTCSRENGSCTLGCQEGFTGENCTVQFHVEDAIHVGCNEYGWDLRVDMVIMRTKYPNIRASDIYLGKNLCTGLDYGSSLLFHQGLRECLTSETISGTKLIFRNELVYAIHDPNLPFIIRRYNWTVQVECDVNRNQTATGHLHHDFSHGTSHHVSGISNYTVNLSYYQDPNFVTPVPGNPLHVAVGTQVYVKVFTIASDWNIKMVVHDCYTKPTPTSPDNTKYDLIRNGCEVDANTHIISQSAHETKFVFEDFEYTSNHEGIYLYCDATFCGSTDYSIHCQQRCQTFV